MDGKESLRYLRQLLNEDANSGFLDDKSSYHYIWEAAAEFADRTNSLTSIQTITTVADQTDYTLNADFSKMYMKDHDNELFIRYYDGTTYTFIPWKPYEEIIYETNTTSVDVPSYFTIVDDAVDSQVSSTTTSNGAATAGQCTLTDSAGDLSDVSAGDVVHNTTDGSVGVVLSKTSSTVGVTALFDGTANDWTSGDAYVIQPQARFKIVLDPPPSTASETITVYYNQRPAPVFSDYGMYKLQQKYIPSIIKYAAWLYKYRDQEPDFGNAWFQIFDREVRKANGTYNSSVGKHKLKVSFKKRGR